LAEFIHGYLGGDRVQFRWENGTATVAYENEVMEMGFDEARDFMDRFFDPWHARQSKATINDKENFVLYARNFSENIMDNSEMNETETGADAASYVEAAEEARFALPPLLRRRSSSVVAMANGMPDPRWNVCAVCKTEVTWDLTHPCTLGDKCLYNLAELEWRRTRGLVLDGRPAVRTCELCRPMPNPTGLCGLCSYESDEKTEVGKEDYIQCKLDCYHRWRNETTEMTGEDMVSDEDMRRLSRRMNALLAEEGGRTTEARGRFMEGARAGGSVYHNIRNHYYR
jgi:hypothetical protein